MHEWFAAGIMQDKIIHPARMTDLYQSGMGGSRGGAREAPAPA